ncbi:hypothetical protein EPN42_02635 [bacterium]|nr:MAG: hypothetical protein EPN42_02635 [bacterium]
MTEYNDIVQMTDFSPASDAGPACPGCKMPLRLRGTKMTAEGVSYELFVISCRNCGHPISALWHPRMMEAFTERMVDIVLEDLTRPLNDGLDLPPELSGQP